MSRIERTQAYKEKLDAINTEYASVFQSPITRLYQAAVLPDFLQRDLDKPLLNSFKRSQAALAGRLFREKNPEDKRWQYVEGMELSPYMRRKYSQYLTDGSISRSVFAADQTKTQAEAISTFIAVQPTEQVFVSPLAGHDPEDFALEQVEEDIMGADTIISAEPVYMTASERVYDSWKAAEDRILPMAETPAESSNLDLEPFRVNVSSSDFFKMLESGQVLPAISHRKKRRLGLIAGLKESLETIGSVWRYPYKEPTREGSSSSRQALAGPILGSFKNFLTDSIEEKIEEVKDGITNKFSRLHLPSFKSLAPRLASVVSTFLS